MLEARSPPGGLLASLVAWADQGEPHAIAARDELVEHLATGLASAVNLLNPELILLGGVFDDAPPSLLGQIEDVVQRRVFPLLRGTVKVRRSSLGLVGGAAGDAAVALDSFFYSAGTG